MTAQCRLCLATLIVFAPALGAQQPTPSTPPAAPKTGKAQIVGVVVDSLNGRYLSDADVVIEGTKTTLETDSLGQFEIDTLAPGTYQVGVFHPLLDSLGIALATKPFHIGPDSSSFILLAVPSAATIVHGICPVQSNARGSSAVIGHVNDPETLQPVAQAEVSVAWTEIEVSSGHGTGRRRPAGDGPIKPESCAWNDSALSARYPQVRVLGRETTEIRATRTQAWR